MDRLPFGYNGDALPGDRQDRGAPVAAMQAVPRPPLRLTVFDIGILQIFRADDRISIRDQQIFVPAAALFVPRSILRDEFLYRCDATCCILFVETRYPNLVTLSVSHDKYPPCQETGSSRPRSRLSWTMS